MSDKRYIKLKMSAGDVELLQEASVATGVSLQRFIELAAVQRAEEALRDKEPKH
jgi:uncharacterized protein (DUF1778 family)